VTAGATGVARYVTELDRALVAAGIELRRFAVGRGPHAAPAGTRRLPVPMRVLHRTWRVLPIPRVEHIAGQADLVHVTDLVPPPTRLPLVITVHDLDALDRPDLHGRRARALQLAQLAAARERADAVIADSAATAGALRGHGVDADRIAVVRLGCTALPAPDPTAVPDGPYLLAVGTIDARKGIDTLVEAFGRADVDGVRLVIAGPEGYQAAQVDAAVAEAGIADRVLLPGRVSDAALAGLYAGATAYCLPSRAEGFGLPVLEAMAAGSPVIASDLPVLREIAEGAAAFVPVDDVDAWVAAIEGVVGDDGARAAQAVIGRQRASEFTWTATAEATVAVYERLLDSQPGSRA